jgi:hypothetical protein
MRQNVASLEQTADCVIISVNAENQRTGPTEESEQWQKPVRISTF